MVGLLYEVGNAYHAFRVVHSVSCISHDVFQKII